MIDPAELTSYLRRSKLRPVRTGADAPDLAPDNSAAERQAAINSRPMPAAPEGLGSAVVNALSQVGSAAVTGHYRDEAAKSRAPQLEYNTAANPFQKTAVPRGGAGLDFARPRVSQGRQLNVGGTVPMFGRGGTLKRNGDAAIVGDEGPELAVKDGRGTHVLPLDAPYVPPRPTLTDVLSRQPPQLGSAASDPGAQPTARLGSEINADLVRRNFSSDADAPTPAIRPRTVTPASPATAPYSGQVKRADEILADQLRPAIGSSPPPNAPGTASAPSPDAQTRARRVVENPDPVAVARRCDPGGRGLPTR
jgi:hypothetical protein